MNLLDRTTKDTPANEAKIRGIEKDKNLLKGVEYAKNVGHAQYLDYRGDKDVGFCQSCKTHFDGKGDLCPVCKTAMHEELDEVFKEYPYPCEERLNAIHGVKAGYGYKVY